MYTKRTLNNSNLSKRVKKLAFSGATWEEIEKEIGLSRITIRPIIKATYKNDTCYQKFLKTLRDNKKKSQPTEITPHIENIPEETTLEETKEVIVTETGFLLHSGLPWVFNESLEIFIPYLCIKELTNLAREFPEAAELLNLHYSTNRFNVISLYGNEVLFEDEDAPLKKARSRGIVAVCCELFARGYKVRLLTNSIEVANLARAQGCGFDIILKHF